jgi:hypothetical protein
VTTTCPGPDDCVIRTATSIHVTSGRGDRVTQNARLRTFNRAGQLSGWRDKSCAGANTCATPDYIYLLGGMSASIQCNGVRQATAFANSAVNTCRIDGRFIPAGDGARRVTAERT